MGAAAYNRGTLCLARQIAAERPSHTAVLLADLNATPRKLTAQCPWGPVQFTPGHGGWWAECSSTGFGYHYPTLRAALADWLVTIVDVRVDVDGTPCYVAK